MKSTTRPPGKSLDLKKEPRRKKKFIHTEQLHVPICFCLTLTGTLKSGRLLGRREVYIQLLREREEKKKKKAAKNVIVHFRETP